MTCHRIVQRQDHHDVSSYPTDRDKLIMNRYNDVSAYRTDRDTIIVTCHRILQTETEITLTCRRILQTLRRAHRGKSPAKPTDNAVYVCNLSPVSTRSPPTVAAVIIESHLWQFIPGRLTLQQVQPFLAPHFGLNRYMIPRAIPLSRNNS